MKTAVNSDVIIYTKSMCSQCDNTKQLFAKLGIDYNEINIEENPEVIDFLKAEGFMSAPVVFTADDSWSGFNKEKIESILNTHSEANGLDPLDDDETWDF